MSRFIVVQDGKRFAVARQLIGRDHEFTVVGWAVSQTSAMDIAQALTQFNTPVPKVERWVVGGKDYGPTVMSEAAE